jgi:hypothetical protein
MTATKRLAEELDVAILLVSHEPKAEYRSGVNALRGHTAWSSHSDELFRLEAGTGLRRLVHVKYRGVDQLPVVEVKRLREGEPNTGPARLVGSLADSRDERARLAREKDTERLEGFLFACGGSASWGTLRVATAEWSEAGKQWSTNRLKAGLGASARIGQPGGPGADYALVEPKNSIAFSHSSVLPIEQLRKNG